MGWLFWALLSALFAGLTAIFAKLGVRHIDSDLATAIRTVVVVVLAWAIVFVRFRPAWSDIGARTWLFLVLSGLATGASWLCYFRALQLGDAAKVAPIDKLSVLVVILLAALLLGETVTWRHWAGGALIAVGSILIARG